MASRHCGGPRENGQEAGRPYLRHGFSNPLPRESPASRAYSIPNQKQNPLLTFCSPGFYTRGAL